MPSKNSLKQYVENGYYHIYNRGVEKRNIFLDSQDYTVFLSYLKEYLSPKDVSGLQNILAEPQSSSREKDRAIKALRLANFADDVALICYGLMPNHIHLLIKQTSPHAIYKFMLSLCIRYGMFFNRKYTRTGQLFQDVYKAILVESDEQLLYLTGYIHRNPAPNLFSQPSSYPDYIGDRKTPWLHQEAILPYFSTTNPKLSYRYFVEGIDKEQMDLVLTNLAIDI